MQKVRLGKSELEVTKIGFGGIPIQRPGEQEAIKVIRQAIPISIRKQIRQVAELFWQFAEKHPKT